MLKKLTNEIDRLLGGEIKEMKFGCEVIFVKALQRGGSEEHIGKISEVFKNGGYKIVSETYKDPEMVETIQVLGRPINLEDVMMAIEKKGIDSEQQHIYILSKFIFGRHSLWKLGKPLSQQSDETINSIAEILK